MYVTRMREKRDSKMAKVCLKSERKLRLDARKVVDLRLFCVIITSVSCRYFIR